MNDKQSKLTVDLPLLIRLLAVAQPVMEAWAKSHELHEWHCRCEDLIGTAYPINLCPCATAPGVVNVPPGDEGGAEMRPGENAECPVCNGSFGACFHIKVLP